MKRAQLNHSAPRQRRSASGTHSRQVLLLFYLVEFLIFDLDESEEGLVRPPSQSNQTLLLRVHALDRLQERRTTTKKKQRRKPIIKKKKEIHINNNNKYRRLNLPHNVNPGDAYSIFKLFFTDELLNKLINFTN